MHWDSKTNTIFIYLSRLPSFSWEQDSSSLFSDIQSYLDLEASPEVEVIYNLLEFSNLALSAKETAWDDNVTSCIDLFLPDIKTIMTSKVVRAWEGVVGPGKRRGTLAVKIKSKPL